MNNTEFNYLYRDASNYKKWGSVIFSGAPDDLEAFETEFRAFLDDGDFFIASQVDVPEVFLYAAGGFALNEDDHCFHEFDSFELTDKEPTDEQDRSIMDFFEAVKEANEQSWKVADPSIVVERARKSKDCELQRLNGGSAYADHWQWISKDGKSESQVFESQHEALQVQEAGKLEWNGRCRTAWWQYGAANKTSYAKSIGYVGASPVIVQDGRVWSKDGMPWEKFCEKCRAGEFNSPNDADVHLEMMSEYGCLVGVQGDDLVWTALHNNNMWSADNLSDLTDPWAATYDEGNETLNDMRAQDYIDEINNLLGAEFTLDHFRRMVPVKSEAPKC